MLCEQCQSQEATIHLALVVGESDTRHSFCEGCYPSTEPGRKHLTAGWTSYEQPPKPLPLPAQIELITVSGYLDAAAKARINGADKPVFDHINSQLEKMPQTQRRLVFELLPLIWRSLESGDDAMELVIFTARWSRSITSHAVAEYASWVEKISFRCFELLGQRSDAPRDPFMLSMSLCWMLRSLSRVDRDRFANVFKSLKMQCGDANHDTRLEILASVEDSTERDSDAG